MPDTSIPAQPSEVRAVHPFERAGLGRAPFRFVGMEQQDLCYGEAILNRAEYQRTGVLLTTAPGGTCAYCGTYIVQMCNIVSADGRRFHVGTDCVAKTCGPKLVAGVKKVLNAKAREKRQAKAVENAATLDALLADGSPVAVKLASMPHGNAYRASLGETALDAARYRASLCGAAGCAKMLRELRSMAS